MRNKESSHEGKSLSQPKNFAVGIQAGRLECGLALGGGAKKHDWGEVGRTANRVTNTHMRYEWLKEAFRTGGEFVGPQVTIPWHKGIGSPKVGRRKKIKRGGTKDSRDS